MSVHEGIETLRSELKVVEDLYAIFNDKSRSETYPETCGADRKSNAMDFINWPDRYHHRWRNELDDPNCESKPFAEYQEIAPWAFYLPRGHEFLYQIITGKRVENIPMVRELLEYHCFDLDRARFFFGKANGPGLTEGHAFFAAVPVHTDLGKDRPFTLVFQIGLYYAGMNVILIADTVENLVTMKNMPWDDHWQDNEEHFPPDHGIILIDPEELNGPQNQGTKHPIIHLTVRHEFFDCIRHYRFLQDLYGIHGLGSLRSASEHYTKFLGVLTS